MAEDRTVELAHFVAAVIVRDTDRIELPTIYAAAHAIAGNDRAAARFGQAISAAIVCELRDGQAPAGPHFLFPNLKEKP